LPKDYTCTICTLVFKVIRENIILVQCVHEFLKLLGKRLCLFDIFMTFYKFSIRLYLYCTICTCIFKVIREKIILVQYVHEFLELFITENVCLRNTLVKYVPEFFK
jgi:hypothetical protein